MDIPEKARLGKLLGMLGSSFDGERANAARLISAMAMKHGLTVVELIYSAYARHDRRRSQSGWWQEDPQAEAMSTLLNGLAEIADDPDRYEVVLTEWEFHFAIDVSARYSRDYELSAKQLAVIEKILRKAARARKRE